MVDKFWLRFLTSIFVYFADQIGPHPRASGSGFFVLFQCDITAHLGRFLLCQKNKEVDNCVLLCGLVVYNINVVV